LLKQLKSCPKKAAFFVNIPGLNRNLLFLPKRKAYIKMENTKILDVKGPVKWIGILDPGLVTFDIVMETKYGTTYNSYFIDAEKKAIVETSKETFKEEYLDKVREVCNPNEIEYIIANHTEPDHSGNIKHLLEIAPNATVVGSGQAMSYLSEMMGIPFKHQVVKDGDVIDLGNKKLRVIGAANLHWPDSIYTYLEEEKVLFTCDSFGAHYCHEAMFDDQIDDYQDAFTYYFDVILKPFSKFMLKAIDKIKDFDIDVICPGHGPILRGKWKEKVALSKALSEKYMSEINNENKNILITYVSAYGYTKEIAEAIGKQLRSKSRCEVDVVDIEHIALGELEEKIVRANALLVGSPTINQNTLLPIYKMFALINPIRDKQKPAAVFGSYGWSGEAIHLIESHLKILKLNVVQEGLPVRFFPHNDKMALAMDFADRFLKHIEN
jgi:NADH oxidase (H2O-forming)